MLTRCKTCLIAEVRSFSKKADFNFGYFLKNGFWMATKPTATLVGGLILSIVFARFATKEIFGQYNILISYLTLASVFSLPGLNVAIFRAGSKNYDGVYRSAVKMSLRFGTLGMISLAIAGLYFLFIENNQLFGIALIISAIFFPFMYSLSKWDILLMSKEKFDISGKYYSLVTIVSYLLVVLAVFLKSESLLIIFSVYLITNSFFHLLMYIKTRSCLENRTEEKDWKKTGWILSFVSFFDIIYSNADKIILAFFLDSASVAVYSISMTVSSQLRNIVGRFLQIYTPKIYKLELSVFFDKLKKTSLFFGVPFLLSLISIALFIPSLINLLYTEKYSESAAYAQLALITVPFYLVTSILIIIANKERKESAQMASKIISGIINLALYLLLIPRLGILGAVIASVSFFMAQSMIMLGLIGWKFMKKTS